MVKANKLSTEGVGRGGVNMIGRTVSSTRFWKSSDSGFYRNWVKEKSWRDILEKWDVS